MERIAPAPKDKSVSFPLPEMKDAMDASKAASSVLTAVSEGELTPIEATRVMGLIGSNTPINTPILTPREVAMSIYDNPKYFPPYDAMETVQVYIVPNTASGTDCALIVDLVG